MSAVNAVGFLLIVVVISVLGSLWVWYRQRRPTTLMSSVEDFQREMDALARASTTPPGRSGGQRGRRKGTPEPILRPDTAEERARRLREARRPHGRREG